MKTFTLDLVAPRKVVYSGPAEQLTFMSVDGSYGVLHGHEPTLTALAEGLVRFFVDGRWQEYVSSDGFVEIMPDYVRLVAMSMERPEDIDLQRAELAKERAEEKLHRSLSRQQFIQTQAALSRALARLKYGSARKN